MGAKIFLALLFVVLARLLYNLRPLPPRTIVPFGFENCKNVSGPMGVEDIAIDPESGLAILAADVRRPAMHQVAGYAPDFEHVGVYTYNFETEALAQFRLVDYPLDVFHPHGISLYYDRATGMKRLFMVNHALNHKNPSPKDTEAISIFDIDIPTMTLKHVRTVSHDLIRSPNDVLAVGPESFYFTNDMYSRHMLGKIIETMFMPPLSNVGYFDGQEMRIVERRRVFANGMGQSPDGKIVYIAYVSERRLDSYERLANGDLKKINSLVLNGMIDNPDVDPENGDLYIGSHPLPLNIFMHLLQIWPTSPSQGFRIQNPASKDAVISEIFLTHGDHQGSPVDISASTVIAVAPKHFAIGSVFDDGIVVCPRPNK